MADLIRMTAKTTFQNDRIRGGVNGVVSDGDVFETDPNHARDLARLGHAEPVSGSVLDIGPAPLEPHYSVSGPALLADRERRASDADSEAELWAVARTVEEAREKATRDIAEIECKAGERLEEIGRDLATAEARRGERLRALAAEVAEAEAAARAAIEGAQANAAVANAERSEAEAERAASEAGAEGQGASSELKKPRRNG